MIIGRTVTRKPGAWREKPSCSHFGKCQYFAAWLDKSSHGERLIENIPLCESCYRSYVAEVNRKLNEQYMKAEREAEKLLKINGVLKRCAPMFDLSVA